MILKDTSDWRVGATIQRNGQDYRIVAFATNGTDEWYDCVLSTPQPIRGLNLRSFNAG